MLAMELCSGHIQNIFETSNIFHQKVIKM